MPAWEILEYSEESLKQAMLNLGHQTIKVEPLVNKRLLQEHGFFYCDTLIVPSCKKMMLRAVHHPDASILKSIDSEHALEIFHGSFTHGRFHRDFNLPKAAADLRYDNWLKQLIVAQQVYGLYWQDSLAGFIGYKENSLVLHAVAEKYRGKGLSKYWWSEVCATLLAKGHDEVQSSISATNLAALNLYASLGFSFSSPQDVYHRIVL
jgi:L-amino acid N-acyltransferase YncA